MPLLSRLHVLFAPCIAVLSGAFFLAAGSTNLTAQTDDHPFVRPDVPSSPAADFPCDYTYPFKIPVRCWTGQKFIVLPEAPELRHYGYQTFDGGQGENGHASYDELAGKIITVPGVHWSENDRLPALDTYVIQFRADASGTLYTARAVILPNGSRDDAQVDGLAMLRDLEEARKYYVGKTYWLMAGKLPRVGAEITSSDWVKFPRTGRVTVSDVLASDDDAHPVQLVFRNDAGEEGYLNIVGSPTNRSSSLYAVLGNDPLAPDLSKVDPRSLHHWPDNVWDAIVKEKVFAGMTGEQAEMSWGKPGEINRTVQNGRVHEQWVYGDGNYLYFDDGLLTAIQD